MPGIIISANKVVMRTDDIVVDALLGEGDALDDYSQGLQAEAVSAEQVQNRYLDLKNQLLEKIVQAPNINSAEMQVYTRIFGEVPINEIHTEVQAAKNVSRLAEMKGNGKDKKGK